MITIIDYGMGNLGSIVNMVNRIGGSSEITSDISKIALAEKIILPGVGSFDKAMENLKKMDLIKILNKKVINDKVPVLGICLGMQLLTKSSEEGILPGLGWIDGKVLKFQIGENLKVPHMGWNHLNIQKKNQLLKNLHSESRFYFVHSYFFSCNNHDDILSTTEYGKEFTSSVNKDNIFGVQFHPEKSHKFGMQLLENFIEIPLA